MNAEQFKQRFGTEPLLDDLERVNCKEAGMPGHHSCGICRKHKKPRFMCGCLRFNRKNIKEGTDTAKHICKQEAITVNNEG